LDAAHILKHPLILYNREHTIVTGAKPRAVKVVRCAV